MSELLVSEETLRKMPFSMEAEQSVLGSIIIDPEKMRDIVTGLRAEDFYLEQHARIYDAMKNIFIRPDCNLDEVTLLDELVRMGADIRTDGRCAAVIGVKGLTGAHVVAQELRGGAALVAAALSAEGESVIEIYITSTEVMKI